MNFTVKHRAADGTETLYACDTITVIGGPEWARPIDVARNMYEEGIFLDREQQCSAPDEPVFFTSKHIIQFGGDETSDRAARKGGKVWVMSESGATVASYDL